MSQNLKKSLLSYLSFIKFILQIFLWWVFFLGVNNFFIIHIFNRYFFCFFETFLLISLKSKTYESQKAYQDCHKINGFCDSFFYIKRDFFHPTQTIDTYFLFHFPSFQRPTNTGLPCDHNTL